MTRTALLIIPLAALASLLAFTAGVWGVLGVAIVCMGIIVVARTREEHARASRRALGEAVHDIDDPTTRALARAALMDAITAPDASGRRASLAQAQAIVRTASQRATGAVDDATL